jgi:hypothetical protein
MKLNSLLLIILSSPSCFSQSAKDFFFPSAGKNTSVFNTAKEMPAKFKTQVFFKDMGDSAIVTTMFYHEDGSKGGQEQVVKVGDSAISVIRGKTNTSKGVEYYNADGKIIFKMPSANGKVAWENTGQKGAVIETYEAEFSTLEIDGKNRRAVKLTTIEKRKRSGKQQVFYVDYYVEGIGRYKRTAPDEAIVIEVLTDQLVENNPPTVK